MKLKSCHIDGFGKLIDCDYNFESGNNIFLKDNGYGKSTLASFIKTMLYGFDDENKRSLKDKEREKFRPWDKSGFGGRLVFEYEKEEYEITRLFGKNENEDTFEVRVVRTNALTDMFNKDSVGLELFGIDKESFYRTAYIASRDLGKREESVSGSIRAKLGNLTEASDDINNYETVMETFRKKMNEMSPDRKTGKIKALKNEIAEMKNRVRETENIDKSIEILEGQIQAEHNKIEIQKEKLTLLNEEEKKAVKKAGIEAKKQTYNTLLKEYEDSKKSAAESIALFTKKVPSDEEIAILEKNIAESKHLFKKMEENRFHKDDTWNEMCKRFERKNVKENETDEYIEKWNEVLKLRSEEEILRSNLANEKRIFEENCLEKKKQNEELLKSYLKKEKETKKKKTVIFVSIGAVLAIIVLLLFFVLKMQTMPLVIAPGILAALSLAAFALAVVSMLMPPKKYTAVPESDNVFENFSDTTKFNEINGKLTEVFEKQTAKKEAIVRYLGEYSIPFDENNVLSGLLKLRDDIKEYKIGKEKMRLYEETVQKYEENEKVTENLLDSFGVMNEGDTTELISIMKAALVKYYEHIKESDRKKIIIENFEADNNIAELNQEFEEVRNADDIRDEISEITEETEAARETLRMFRTRLEALQEERAVLEDIKGQIADSEEKLDGYIRNYKIMEYTASYLAKAKDELSLKYTGPTMKAFEKYYGAFSEDITNFRIDTDFNLTKIEAGAQRSPSSFSLGLRDVTDFCMRLALVDAMYEKEKPFVILDDPFINMDMKNLNAAKKVMDMLAKEYQVIYFTCHETRA